MDQNAIILLVGGFLLTHFSAVFGALVWAIRHIVKYNLLVENFSTLTKKVESLERELDIAFNKIREVKK